MKLQVVNEKKTCYFIYREKCYILNEASYTVILPRIVLTIREDFAIFKKRYVSTTYLIDVLRLIQNKRESLSPIPMPQSIHFET